MIIENLWNKNLEVLDAYKGNLCALEYLRINRFF